MDRQRNAFTPTGLYQKIKLPWSHLQIPWTRPETHGKVDIDKLEANFEALREQIDAQSLYLNRTDWGPAVGSRWATIVLAAYDSTNLSKQSADFVCGASNADVAIQAAINTLVARTTQGRIVLLEGTYTLAAALTVTITAGKALCIQGMGSGTTDATTKITYNSSNTLLTVTGASGDSSTLFLRDIALVNSSSGNCVATNVSRVDVDHCYIASSTGPCFNLAGGLSSSLRGSRITNSRIAGGSRGITVSWEEQSFFCDNHISVTGSGARGISLNGDAGYNLNAMVSGNRISGAGSGAWGIACNNSTGDGTYVEDTLISNNYVTGFSSGILLNGAKNCIISGNILQSNTIAIESTSVGAGVGNQRIYIVSNFIYDSSGTYHVRIIPSTAGTSDIAILYNKFRGTTPSYAVSLSGISVANCAVAFNDTYSAWSVAAVDDNGNATRRESDLIGPTITTNARLGFRKNTGGSTFLRRRMNLIEGTDFSITLADDSVDEEVDVTLGLATTITSNARVAVAKNNGAVVGTRRQVDFIEGSGITLGVVDDSANERVQVTINQAAGAGTGDVEGQFIVGFDGGGATIAANKVQDIQAPFAGTIDSWKIYADVADTVSVEVWKDTYVNFPPTVADKITAAAPITLTAADHNSSSAVGTWTTAVLAGDVLRFKITAVTLATRILVVVHYTRP